MVNPTHDADAVAKVNYILQLDLTEDNSDKCLNAATIESHSWLTSIHIHDKLPESSTHIACQSRRGRERVNE